MRIFRPRLPFFLGKMQTIDDGVCVVSLWGRVCLAEVYALRDADPLASSCHGWSRGRKVCCVEQTGDSSIQWLLGEVLCVIGMSMKEGGGTWTVCVAYVGLPYARLTGRCDGLRARSRPTRPCKILIQEGVSDIPAFSFLIGRIERGPSTYRPD